IPNSHPRLSLDASPARRTRSLSPLYNSALSTCKHDVRLIDTTSPTSPISRGSQDDIAGPTPTLVESFKALFLGGWINVLLIAVPLSFASHFLGWGSTADFIISFIAIIPLAALLGDATEQCALKVGQTVGGLLNATFGNATECRTDRILPIGILALVRGELRIVQTSLLGSILSNLLLVLGCSFIAGGIKFKEQKFQMTAAQASSSLMVLGCSTLIIPAAFHASQLDGSLKKDHGTVLTVLDEFSSKSKDLAQLLTLSRGTAIVLLVCYACCSSVFSSACQQHTELCWMQPDLYFQLCSHAYLFEEEQAQEEEEAKMSITAAVVALLGVTVVTSFCADYLVGAIDEFASDYNIPKAWIGLIALPIVGNAAEHVTSVWMAAKGKMEITIGVAVGSSIQIAVGVIPALVVAGWIINQDLDGISHWLEGVMLGNTSLFCFESLPELISNVFSLGTVALYSIIALAFWVA
ncbi:SPOSA6832_04459, partial [Sporobolomyces salmonicolor]